MYDLSYPKNAPFFSLRTGKMATRGISPIQIPWWASNAYKGNPALYHLGR